MKKLYGAAVIFTIVAAIAAMVMSLTSGIDNGIREMLSKMMIVCALVGIVSIAVMQPRVAQTETAVSKVQAVNDDIKNRCTFSDVAANETAKRSLAELRDYIMEPEKYAKYGARMPRGVLLYGPPGTGKTLMAKALAGEAGVPFFALSGSDFVEKYVGVGAGRVRELFRKARIAGKCVIFIDEIDAMGKKRHDQSSDERDQTLNALLSEMSGFYTGDGVLVIAATNRMEMLDPALLRPGRFDRLIEVSLPGKNERLSILKLHTKNKPLSENVDLQRIAAQTTMFSGASLENLMNEAAISAARRDDGVIDASDIDGAFYRVVAGEDRESAASYSEKCMIALHEAGHALISRLLTPKSNIVRVSILPAGKGAAGYNLCIPDERVIMSRKDFENQICILLAGRGAEMLIDGEESMTAGASGDIARATEIAAAMVLELGMGREPSVSYKVLDRHCTSGVQSGEMCRAILSEQFERARSILGENSETLLALTKALVEEETLTGEQIDRIIGLMSSESLESA